MPELTGPLAGLAEIILGLSIVVLTGELLGTFGLFEFVPLLFAFLRDRRRCPAIGGTSCIRQSGRNGGRRRPAPPEDRATGAPHALVEQGCDRCSGGGHRRVDVPRRRRMAPGHADGRHTLVPPAGCRHGSHRTAGPLAWSSSSSQVTHRLLSVDVRTSPRRRHRVSSATTRSRSCSIIGFARSRLARRVVHRSSVRCGARDAHRRAPWCSRRRSSCWTTPRQRAQRHRVDSRSSSPRSRSLSTRAIACRRPTDGPRCFAARSRPAWQPVPSTPSSRPSPFSRSLSSR